MPFFCCQEYYDSVNHTDDFTFDGLTELFITRKPIIIPIGIGLHINQLPPFTKGMRVICKGGAEKFTTREIKIYDYYKAARSWILVPTTMKDMYYTFLIYNLP